MGKIILSDVKEKLKKNDSFSVFVYLKGDKFFYDTDFKDGCIGVLSTDIASMFGMIDKGIEDYDLVQMQIENASKKSVIKPQYADNEVPTADSRISENRLTSSEVLCIAVPDLDLARKFTNQQEVCRILIDRLAEKTNMSVSEETDIRLELYLDSLDVIEFIMWMEKRFGLGIPDNVVDAIMMTKEEFRTPKWIASFLVSQINLAIQTEK